MSELIEIHSNTPSVRTINKVVDILNAGGVIVYPTDTVYTLGCAINNLAAMERLASIKNINLKKAKFSIVCNDLSHLSHYTKQIDKAQYKVLKKLLPGPYTFILPAAKALPIAYKGHKTVGIRVPDHLVPYEIVSKLGMPIVSTSIHNDEDGVMDYITDPYLIYKRYQKQIDCLLDAGEGGNVASTVVDLTTNPYQVLRNGLGSTELLT